MCKNNQELRVAALANLDLMKLALMTGSRDSFVELQAKREAFYVVCESLNAEHYYRWFDRFDYEDAYRCRHCLKSQPEPKPIA